MRSSSAASVTIISEPIAFLSNFKLFGALGHSGSFFLNFEKKSCFLIYNDFIFVNMGAYSDRNFKTLLPSTNRIPHKRNVWDFFFFNFQVATF